MLKTVGQIKSPSTWMPHRLPIKQIHSSKHVHQRAELGEKNGGPEVYLKGTKGGNRRKTGEGGGCDFLWQGGHSM